jgi:acetolactate synthase I/II/III large subunit
VQRSLADVLADGVARRGADTVFGLPGGGPNLDVVGAAGRAGLRFVLAHGETAACIMAGTYGMLTGRPALAIATRGPGAASAANGVAQATLDRFPLLFVSDCVPTDQRARVAHQRIDQTAVMAPLGKWSGVLGSHEPAEVIDASLRLAAAMPAGAVHLDFDPTAAGDRPPALPALETIDDDALVRAAALLAEARRPVVLAGLACLPWATALRAQLERLGCPVLLTYQCAGLLPAGSPNLAGLFTNGAIERPLLEQADLVLCLGLDAVEPIPAPWPTPAPVLSLHPTPVHDDYVPITVELTGPLDDLLAGLGPSVRSEWPAGHGAAIRRAGLDALAGVPASGQSGALSPLDVVATAAEEAPRNATATVDAGAHFLAVMPFWPTAEPASLLISNGLATMGFAVPAAIGAALARPGRPVVCFVGDGGLAMTMAELETIARLDLPITVVVFNDAALSLIEIKQTVQQGGDDAVRFRSTDFAAMARASGLPGAAVDDRHGLRAALAGGWGSPRLIDVAVDPSSYRHLVTVTRG